MEKPGHIIESENATYPSSRTLRSQLCDSLNGDNDVEIDVDQE